MNKTLFYTSGKLFTNHQTGGTKRFVELLEFYNRNNIKFDLCCQDDRQELEAHGLSAKYHITADVKRYKLIPPELVRLIKNRKVIQSICKEKYDTVISFDVPPTIGLILFGIENICLLLRKDMLEYNNLHNSKGIGGKIKDKYALWAEEKCLKKCKKIFVQCNHDKNALLKRHPGISDIILEKLVVQINNINPTWVQQKAKKLKKNTQPAGSPRVCYIGNADGKRKGMDLFLEAADILCTEGAGIQFDVIGGGSQLEYYKSQYGSDKITFHGRLENPLSVMCEASLVVVPSRADSCPNTVLESLYIGVPVIGSRAGGIPEILVNDDVLFDLNSQSIASLVKRIINDPGFCDSIIRLERERALQLSFNWAQKMHELIK